jgi:hypothetical protein
MFLKSEVKVIDIKQNGACWLVYGMSFCCVANFYAQRAVP